VGPVLETLKYFQKNPCTWGFLYVNPVLQILKNFQKKSMYLDQTRLNQIAKKTLFFKQVINPFTVVVKFSPPPEFHRGLLDRSPLAAPLPERVCWTGQIPGGGTKLDNHGKPKYPKKDNIFLV